MSQPGRVHKSWTEDAMKVVRLLVYIRNMRQDYPDLNWPELPDNYSELTWRYVG